MTAQRNHCGDGWRGAGRVQEIGERLYVSLNTVKTHQRAVYRKLNVEHRNAAVSRARELDLL
jgi:LuxR family maltose regulon positive regulatory protein